MNEKAIADKLGYLNKKTIVTKIGEARMKLSDAIDSLNLKIPYL